MKLLLIVGIFLLVGCVSATSVDFFYSQNCGHCKQVSPIVSKLSNQYKINSYDVSQGSYNIQSVPLIQIKTNDCRNIELIGSQEIPKYLKCELQEMTTKECPTSSFNKERQSWFIR